MTPRCRSTCPRFARSSWARRARTGSPSASTRPSRTTPSPSSSPRPRRLPRTHRSRSSTACPPLRRDIPGRSAARRLAPDVLFAALHARPTSPVDLPLEEVPPDAVDRSAERARPQGGRRELHDQAQGRRGPRRRTSTAWPTSCAERSSGLVRSSRSTSWWGSAPKRRASCSRLRSPRASTRMRSGAGCHSSRRRSSTRRSSRGSTSCSTRATASTSPAIRTVVRQRSDGRGPDLQIRNTTPYGILIWPSYTNSSLTVTLFSTKYFSSVDQSNQTSAPSGVCTSVVTERTRVYLDGTKKVDVVRARYRPSEGINCDGSGPGTTTTTTSTTVPAETTVAPTTVPPTAPTEPATTPTVPVETVPTVPTTVLLAPSTP